MFKKIGILQIVSFVAILGLLALVLVMRNNQAKLQQQLAEVPIPVTGAEATATPEPFDPAKENSIITLSDASRIELLGGSELVVSEETYQDMVGFAANLIKGEMLLMLPPEGEYWFVVHTQGGYTARLKGCSMAVSYAPDTDAFAVDCINGSCEFVDEAGNTTALQSGQRLALTGGALNAVESIDTMALDGLFASSIDQCAPLIPVTGGGRRTVTPTPRPATATPRLDLTATQACVDFHADFPSTPCP